MDFSIYDRDFERFLLRLLTGGVCGAVILGAVLGARFSVVIVAAGAAITWLAMAGGIECLWRKRGR